MYFLMITLFFDLCPKSRTELKWPVVLKNDIFAIISLIIAKKASFYGL